MRDQRSACSKQFWARSFNINWRTIFKAERNLMVEARIFARFKLSLRNCSLECNIPQAWSVFLISLSTSKIAQECFLCNSARLLANSVISLRPINRKTKPTPQSFKKLLILRSQALTKLNKVLSAYRNLILSFNLLAFSAFKRRLKIRVILQRSIHSHTVIVLHAAFCWQAVIIPTHWVENVKTLHTLISRNNIRMRVRKYVTNVQVATNGWRWSIDRIHGLTIARIMECVSLSFVPITTPLVFKTINANFVRKRR
ncbi:Uncharacterised protein [Chlamydia trachomatis]|nr:Uncharacterised protein [Chlamydia trachomatis]